MAFSPTVDKSTSVAAASVIAILKSNEFRRAYHRASDSADKTPDAQLAATRTVIAGSFSFEEIAPSATLDPNSFYFTDKPIEVAGRYKFLVPGTIRRELIPGTLFALTPKTASAERLVDGKEFSRAISAVEAVRLTLVPERVNGIISFLSDAKEFYAKNDTTGAEKAIGTALAHLERAAAEGLRKIGTEAEKGKRSNEVAGTRRTLAGLRKQLQAELAGGGEA